MKNQSKLTGTKGFGLWYTLGAVIMGALLCGMLWRFRGSHGWGGESGVFNAGYVMLLFFALITGSNKKTTPLKIAITSAAFILTTPQWGTINSQICGVISNGDDPLITGVSTGSAIFMMLMLGFTMVGLYSLLLGNIFSEKQWKIHHYIIIVAVFFAVQYICKASVAHPILKLIQPVSEKSFNDALIADKGITTGVYKAYLAHFDNVSWAKKIAGGRNYFAEIELISRFIAVVACIFVTRFAFKDKTCAKLGTFVCLSFAIGITVADLFFYFFSSTGKGIDISFIPAWSSWEYFTGFISGGLATFFVLKFGKLNIQKEYSLSFLPAKAYNIVNYLVGICLPFAFNLARPVIMRFDDSSLQIFVAAAIIAFILFAVIFTGIKSKLQFEKMQINHYFAAAFLTVLIIQTAVYFFGAGENGAIREELSLPNVCVVISFIPAVIFAIAKYLKRKGAKLN